MKSRLREKEVLSRKELEIQLAIPITPLATLKEGRSLNCLLDSGPLIGEPLWMTPGSLEEGAQVDLGD